MDRGSPALRKLEARPRRGTKVEVCISVDVEFSIAGAFTYPDRYRPVADEAVVCNINGVPHGLPLLLQMLDEYRIKGTFFVEALNAAYFGTERMGRIARSIYERGHDVQLHLHPGWMFFDTPHWQTRLASGTRPNDSCSGRAPDELRAIISRGLEVFATWGVPKPVALRTGSLQVDPCLYPIMAEFGIGISSSVGVGYYAPPDATLHLYSGSHRFSEITEVPVLTFWSTFGARLFTIAGCGVMEARCILSAAAERSVSPIVLLTHPHELIKARDARYEKLRPHRVNQLRLRSILEFLRVNDDEFVTTTFRESGERWQAVSSSGDSTLSVPFIPVLLRALDNKLSDWVWIY